METPSSSNQPEQVSPPSIPLEVVANAPANEDEVIAIDDGTDDAPQDGTPTTSHSRGSQKKLTSAVWMDFTHASLRLTRISLKTCCSICVKLFMWTSITM